MESSQRREKQFSVPTMESSQRKGMEEELRHRFEKLEQEWDAYKESRSTIRATTSHKQYYPLPSDQTIHNPRRYSPRQLMFNLQQESPSSPESWRNVRSTKDVAVREIVQERREAIERGNLKGRRLFHSPTTDGENSDCEVRSMSFSNSEDESNGGEGVHHYLTRRQLSYSSSSNSEDECNGSEGVHHHRTRRQLSYSSSSEEECNGGEGMHHYSTRRQLSYSSSSEEECNGGERVHDYCTRRQFCYSSSSNSEDESNGGEGVHGYCTRRQLSYSSSSSSSCLVGDYHDQDVEKVLQLMALIADIRIASASGRRGNGRTGYAVFLGGLAIILLVIAMCLRLAKSFDGDDCVVILVPT